MITRSRSRGGRSRSDFHCQKVKGRSYFKTRTRSQRRPTPDRTIGRREANIADYASTDATLMMTVWCRSSAPTRMRRVLLPSGFLVTKWSSRTEQFQRDEEAVQPGDKGCVCTLVHLEEPGSAFCPAVPREPTPVSPSSCRALTILAAVYCQQRGAR